MQIENEFRVRAPADEVFAFLLDVEEVVHCVPGAELTDKVDDNEYAGHVKLNVGPLKLNFKGSAIIDVSNESAREITLKGKGSDQQGRGAANVTVIARVLDGEEDGSSQVLIEQNLRVTGKIAQFGRGVMKDVSQRLSLEFAECLEGKIASMGSEGADVEAASETERDTRKQPETSAPPKAVGGLRLIFWALRRAVSRLVRRIFGRGEQDTLR